MTAPDNNAANDAAQAKPATVPAVRIITIIVPEEWDERPQADLGGVDPWQAYAVLYEASESLWRSLPCVSFAHLNDGEDDDL